LCVGAGGCSLGNSGDKAGHAADPQHGKELFSRSCAVCHTLADANAAGATGPDLDTLGPTRQAVINAINDGRGGMPAGLVTGQDAQDVAAYVAAANATAQGH
jgi:mono/diheme cytochrome c family protein